MNRDQLSTIVMLVLAATGWLWVAALVPTALPLGAVLLFGLLALTVDALSFRLPPADSYSLAGLLLLTASLALGPPVAALLAAVEGTLAALLLVLLHRQPSTFDHLVARPLLQGGVRGAGVLLGAALATLTGGLEPLPLLLWSAIALVGLAQLVRIGHEALQGGRRGVMIWWRRNWRLSLGAELAPFPLALLGAAIYDRLGSSYFLLAGMGLIATAAIVRRAILNLTSRYRSLRELALLNRASWAIIRSELNVETLCELIYQEAGHIVDTSSFHLGLFMGDRYSLVVRVQDRVRLPSLTVDLSDGDGLIGWIRQSGKALLVEDFLREMDRLPARPRYQSDRPPRSGIYVPLIAGSEVIGSISVQSYQPHAFGAGDLRLLSLIADQAAVAITRARAFHEARVRAVQLQAIHEVSERITAILNLDELLPAVVTLIHEHFGYQPVHIFTLDPDGGRIRFRASTATGTQLEQIRSLNLSFGQGIVGTAAQVGKPILVDDVQRDPRYVQDSQATCSELAVPLVVGHQVLGVLDLQSELIADFDADDLFVMRTLADQIAIAIDGANLYRAQQEEAWTLNALLQAAEQIGQADSMDQLLTSTARLLPQLLGLPRCYLLLWDAERAHFLLRATYGITAEEQARLSFPPEELARLPLLARLQAMVVDGQRLLTIATAQERGEVWPQLPDGGCFLVLLPLLGRAGLLGALILDYDEEPTLNERRINLCVDLARKVATALESLQLAREAELAARLEQELRVAREIQTALLPATLPHLPGWQIDATWRSARLVGGDFFDFWPLHRTTHPDSAANLGLVIADVSDKGVPAAMFMSMARSLVRAAALDGSAPSRALERANRWISRDSESGMFVTLFYAILDPQSGWLRYTVAGHNPPLHFHAAEGRVSELRTPGIALGVLEEITLGEAETLLAPGDLLVCYTDGVTEAINDQQLEFGVPRLRELMVAYQREPAEVVMQSILNALDQHSQGQPTFDDVTLVVIKRVGGDR